MWKRRLFVLLLLELTSVVVTDLLLNKLVKPVDVNQEGHDGDFPAEAGLDIEIELREHDNRVDNAREEETGCEEDIATKIGEDVACG